LHRTPAWGLPMHNAIGNRELIVLGGLGNYIRGTLHVPPSVLSHVPAEQRVQGRTGVLFLNSLSLPRAASGDSAVRWADSIAEHGYPSFRIDLPGLGDSGGYASTDLLDSINAGGLAPAAAAVAKELVDRFGLSGLVIFGHCAGSVSAMYAASASKECRGLILLDPYFHLPQAKRPKVREELSEWARRSKAGRLLSNAYDRARNLLLLLRGSALPANANSQLLDGWKQVASSGLPILLLKAPGIKAHGSRPRVGEFDYTGHALKLAGRKSRVSVEFVEGADHSFANYDGREAVKRHIEDWLVSHFPQEDFNRNPKRAVLLRAAEKQSESRKSPTASAELGCALEGR
jgi:pimeloyl-ACP methyl ester carboxylesterase